LLIATVAFTDFSTGQHRTWWASDFGESNRKRRLHLSLSDSVNLSIKSGQAELLWVAIA
jgi:hypothetical protein